MSEKGTREGRELVGHKSSEQILGEVYPAPRPGLHEELVEATAKALRFATGPYGDRGPIPRDKLEEPMPTPGSFVGAAEITLERLLPLIEKRLLSDEAVEAAARAIAGVVATDSWQAYEDLARAALRAAVDEALGGGK